MPRRTILVFGKKSCARCASVKDALATIEADVVPVDLDDPKEYVDAARDALATALCEGNTELPLLTLDGEFVSLGKILERLDP